MVVAAVVAFVAEIVVIHVDISAVADNSNRVGAIVLYIEEDPVVDSIDIEEPVAVDNIDIGLVDIAKHKAKHKVDIVDTAVVADMFYKAVEVQDKKDKVVQGKEDKRGMQDKVDKEHTVVAKAEGMVFYTLVVDMILDEWVRVQNCNYHNILHSILAYIYHY